MHEANIAVLSTGLSNAGRFSPHTLPRSPNLAGCRTASVPRPTRRTASEGEVVRREVGGRPLRGAIWTDTSPPSPGCLSRSPRQAAASRSPTLAGAPPLS
ncbi:hypothetical protein AGIG_G18354 [Arapaima gigas]